MNSLLELDAAAFPTHIPFHLSKVERRGFVVRVIGYEEEERR
jgi:hypothetical protein